MKPTGTDGDILFLGLSWEERCFLGLKADYRHHNQILKVLIFYNRRSQQEDKESLEKIKNSLSKKNAVAEYVELDYDDPFSTWRNIEKTVDANKDQIKKTL